MTDSVDVVVSTATVDAPLTMASIDISGVSEVGPRGLPGADGAQGDPGTDGANGSPGVDGQNGADGADGASAYEVAVADGFVGTEAAWLASLVGPAGANGSEGADGAPGVVEAIIAGANVTVDATDPANPIVSASGGGGSGTVESVTATDATITVDNTDPANPTIAVTAGAFATATQGATADSAVQPGDLTAVATSGDYADLSGTPSLGTAAGHAATDFATAAQGAEADSAVQPGDLATVATTGAYADLTGKPTLGTAAAAATTDFDVAGAADAKVIDSIADADATHAPSRNAVFDALALKAPLASPALTGTPTAPTPSAGDNDTSIATTAFVTNAVAKQSEVLIIAVSDETTAITTGAAKVTFRMPFAMSVTAVRASLTTASTSGIPAINVNESGTSIFSTTLTIDANELTSTTAATPAVISDSSLADDAQMTVDIDTAGTGAKGLKVYLIGTRT